MGTIEDEDLVPLTLRLSPTLHADLVRIAKRDERSLAGLIRLALKEFAAREGADASD